ncbi:MAG: PRC-barrel domain-containing protein [Pirellulaceae bacterium]|nr:PRC-barrel domain-containing protein [Pirellulaceae bacterium]
MKRLFRNSVLTMACSCLAIGALVAQDSTQTRTAVRDTSHSPVRMIRASHLIGMNIENQAGESLGEVNDLMLDSETGKINYAAVTYGGFLGIGNKMFAVPYEAFHTKVDPNNAKQNTLVLNVSESELKGAVGFDEQNWPNFADKDFVDDLHRRYHLRRDAHGNLERFPTK